MSESQDVVQPANAGAAAKPKPSWKKVVLWAVVGGGALFWVTIGQRNADSDKILTQTTKQLSKLPAYASNAEFLTPLLKREHAVAFNQAYTSRGKRTAAKFDWDLYFEKLLDPLAAECKKAGRNDIADQLKLARTFATKSK